MKALFIDDDQVNNQIMEMILHDLDFKDYKIVASANEATELLDQCGSQNPFPTHIFLDLNMPGMNGYEFLDMYKNLYSEEYPNTKVLIVSSAPAHLEKDRISKFNFVTTYIEKPMLDSELARHLEG